MPTAPIAELVTPVSTTELSASAWHDREAAHQSRADEFTRGRRERSSVGATHPVDDFLFTYYPFRPGLLRRWHPGADVVLRDAAGESRASWKWYRSQGNDVSVDAVAFTEANRRSIRFILGLLASTATRQASFGCFGLHEWAMVYQKDELRHEVPLRLGQRDTDAVVKSHNIVCTHFDAFRFFTPEAVGLNRRYPTRENQPELEQSGCLHAGMDVYKWVTKLGPLIPGELLLDCFELARDIRQTDMRASPYDLSDWGYAPIAIETADGKAEYVQSQRRYTERGNVLRARVIATVEPVLSSFSA
ncbi:hypothetical protein B0I08_104286 [Glaciihabitans tibetensis]|uniref:3-methyladenine DNA glycosylase n=1 Tax=Glaciihabitans tibetensis TaxID=1266600 RepID=A0A2T0VEF9_9MICO|nr:3-methyladenine DNA glycosylase [Glaciihabitans tibetensis]PRY68583.1 hypothetical protein B0I08_104286 [Glaciihabitans tibetensis]